MTDGRKPPYYRDIVEHYLRTIIRYNREEWTRGQKHLLKALCWFNALPQAEDREFLKTLFSKESKSVPDGLKKLPGDKTKNFQRLNYLERSLTQYLEL